MVECFDPEKQLHHLPICSLKHVLHEALTAYLSVLDRYTLNDLTQNKDALRAPALRAKRIYSFVFSFILVIIIYLKLL